MEFRLSRIESKIDKMQSDIVEIKDGYKEHERRSLANEASVEVLRHELAPFHGLLLQIRLLHRIIILAAAIGTFIVSIGQILAYLK